jgi:hypothetical protein
MNNETVLLLMLLFGVLLGISLRGSHEQSKKEFEKLKKRSRELK